MADPLYELLIANDQNQKLNTPSTTTAQPSALTIQKYLSRILSLQPADLTTTEPASLTQSLQSNLLSLQALSSRSHRSTTTSSDHFSSLSSALPSLIRTATEVRNAVPQLDESAVQFAGRYSRARVVDDAVIGSNDALKQRKESMLFSRQAEKLQDILELPNLLSTAIASAAWGPAGSANYTQALDLFTHIKRLQILYPDSRLIADVLRQAEEALKDMTENLVGSLRGQNLRLAAAIRTVGWLRRVVPELGETCLVSSTKAGGVKAGVAGAMGPMGFTDREEEQSEGTFGALFLVARLATFLSMTEDALAPLRDLADQETEKRLHYQGAGQNTMPQITRRASAHTPSHSAQGQQTERYLKRYIEIFREQSFGTIQMYKNIFPVSSTSTATNGSKEKEEEDLMKLPPALSSFPLHLVGLLMETLQTYLPNITDVAARESLLIQVLYAANSLGRLGADFSMLISLLDLPSTEAGLEDEEGEAKEREPEWYRVVKKHKVQAARLDALASGQDGSVRRGSQDVSAK
ncbi:hypothetical protein H2198_005356 [Neophaeococcomyces mojaviensis]|uniref:Uncharacterized protein n=1 Tax=Neophaeococcomyces mojaviensis TaxID=3383035 RepID=A0ACC3A6I4_9EURO|nr:hypothetical protein H2198_005356 [Knufia sp. JES_112]